jgi:hypothetical protein
VSGPPAGAGSNIASVAASHQRTKSARSPSSAKRNGYLSEQYQSLFEQIVQIVAKITAVTPELEMRDGWRGDHCVVRVGRVSLYLYPYSPASGN